MAGVARVGRRSIQMLKRRFSSTRFPDHGRVCLSNNGIERALRGIAPVNQVHRVHTIARVTWMLDEDEDRLSDVANEMDQKKSTKPDT